MALVSQPQPIYGVLMVSTPSVVSDTVSVSVGPHEFTLPHYAVPHVPDGTVVGYIPNPDGDPEQWVMPPTDVEKHLGLSKAVVRKGLKALGVTRVGLDAQLFQCVFSQPLLVHETVSKTLQDPAAPYETLSRYPVTTDSVTRAKHVYEAFANPVLGAYYRRYGRANAFLLLQTVYGLSAPTAISLWRRVNFSVAHLARYPYLPAYMLDSHDLDFAALDTIAQVHRLSASRPERVHAAVFWASQRLTFKEGRLYFRIADLMTKAEDALTSARRGTAAKSSAPSGLRPLLESAWAELVATGYADELDPKPNGDRVGCVARMQMAIRQSAKLGAQLIQAPAGPPLPLAPLGPRLLGASLTQEQRDVIKAMTHQRLTVVTGGPGFGKTFVVSAAVLGAITAPVPTEVLVVAPTARAAVRAQQQTLRMAHAAGVPSTQMALARFLTMHRALGMTPTSSGDYVPVKLPPLVIVDEASMVDAVLAHKLFRLIAASGPDVRLALVGDPCQLAPVGIGHVLRYILMLTPPAYHGTVIQELSPVNAKRHQQNPVTPALDALREAILVHDGVRQSGLSKTARRTAAQGLLAQALTQLHQASTVTWKSGVPLADVETAVVKDIAAWHAQRPGEPFLVLTPYRVAKVLNASRLNVSLHHRMHQTSDLVAGEPVVVRQNRLYDLAQGPGTFYVPNAMPGIIAQVGAHDLDIAVDDPESATGTTIIRLPLAGYGDLFDLAYVDTVHAAQGGEAPHVVIIGSPADADPQAKTLQVQWAPRLLYTALSRVQDTSQGLGTITILGTITADTLKAWNDPVSNARVFGRTWLKGFGLP